MEKLPKEFKEKWIAALRSGEYKQGRNRLTTDGAYCCLGVAMKVCGLQDQSLSDYCYASIPAEENPDRVPRLFTVSTLDSIPWKLANMNDYGKSFSEIADWIEQNL